MYDVIIIGSGPAGLSAALYAGRYKMKTAVISKDFGGTPLEAHWVENYLGFEGLAGAELAEKFVKHAKKFGAEFIEDEVTKIEQKNKIFAVYTEKKKYEAKTIILATGMIHRKLEIPGENKFLGKGISYCYTCDGPLFKNKVVGVAGGANSACNGALMLSEYAKKVYIIYRGEKLRGEPILVEQIKKNPKIQIVYKTNIKEIKGDKFMTAAVLDTGEELRLEGLFVEIGLVPITALIKPLKINTDEQDFIITDDYRATNIPGVFAAGDILAGNKIKQVIAAASDGAIAAISAYKFLQGK